MFSTSTEDVEDDVSIRLLFLSESQTPALGGVRVAGTGGETRSLYKASSR